MYIVVLARVCSCMYALTGFHHLHSYEEFLNVLYQQHFYGFFQIFALVGNTAQAINVVNFEHQSYMHCMAGRACKWVSNQWFVGRSWLKNHRSATVYHFRSVQKETAAE